MTNLSEETPKKSYLDYLFIFVAFLMGISVNVTPAWLNISMGLAVLCVLLKHDFTKIKAVLKQPLVWLPALLFFMLALSLLLHENSYGVEMLGKHKKILYVLPLALFFLYDRILPKYFLKGFLLGNVLILAISLLAGFFDLFPGMVKAINPTVVKGNISQNFFMALSAMFWLSGTFYSQGIKRLGYMVLLLLASYNILFMVWGRTGYLALFVAVAVWLFMALSSKQRVVAGFCMFLAVSMFFALPNRAMDRLNIGMKEVDKYLTAQEQGVQYNNYNSMGLRTAFVKESWRMIKEAPILGHGAGSFYYAIPRYKYSVNNPHNAYLLEAVQLGVVGLTVFLGWLFFCYKAAWRLPDKKRNFYIAALSAYMACNFFNSFIIDFSEGVLFVIITAVLAGYAVRTKDENRYILSIGQEV